MDVVNGPADIRSIQFLPYTTPVNGRSGALLRWNLTNNDFLYADLMTWPELGRQNSIEQELRDLRFKQPSPLIHNLQALAQWEYENRRQGIDLLADIDQVEQHRLIVDTFGDRPADLKKQQTVKLKWDTPNVLRPLPDWLIESDHPIRVDFNCKLNCDDFFAWWNNLPADVQKRVECVEDPFTYNIKEWSLANEMVPLALDWAGDAKEVSEGFEYVVFKPSYQSLEELEHLQSKKFYVTHCLDSIVGRNYATAVAVKMKKQWGERLAVCGTVQSESFGQEFSPPLKRNNFGLGFADAIADLPWKDL